LIAVYAIRFSACDDKSCEACKAADGSVMTAQEAQMWIFHGKDHAGCRCHAVYMTAEQLEEWLYYNQDYVSCSSGSL